MSCNDLYISLFYSYNFLSYSNHLMDPLYEANRRQQRRQYNQRHPFLPSLQRRNSGQELLAAQEDNDHRHQPRYRPPPSTIITHELDYRDPGEREVSFCYPNFMSSLGSCCLPCKIFCPCCCCTCCPCSNNPIFIQEMTSLGLLQQWGRYIRVLEPGLHMINPVSQSIIQVNLQTQTFSYEQMAISKDNVQFRVVIMLLYRFVDSLKVAYRMGGRNAQQCLQEITCGSMRSIAGENLLQEIIENRSLVSYKLKQHVNWMMEYWGIHVEVTSIKDIYIDKDIEKVLRSVAVALRTKEAMLISCETQARCAQLYRELNNRPTGKAAAQVRYLNAIDNIINQTLDKQNVIFLKTNLEEKGFEETTHSALSYS